MKNMKRALFVASVMGTLILVLCGAAAKSAVIQLRGEARVAGAIVRLGDVADVFDADEATAKQLASIELAIAPSDASEKTLKSREIQDTLAARGLDLGGHTFSGAAAVRVVSGEAKAAAGRTRRVNTTEMRLAQRRAQEAILAYLKDQVADGEEWNAEVKLSDAQARQLAQTTSPITVAGGQEPWTGTQQFELAAKGLEPLTVEAQVSLPPAVVVAVRPLARGDIVRASDVTLERGKAGAKKVGVADSGFDSVESVVGYEVTRPIAAGAVLTPASARKPLLVQRGEVVTVHAYSSGVHLKTTARSRQAGSDGDLVEVESLTDRARYFARVSGVQQVEVFAAAGRARSEE
jgi:flagella basal body P-ring formation protein FlgA